MIILQWSTCRSQFEAEVVSGGVGPKDSQKLGSWEGEWQIQCQVIVAEPFGL